MIRWPDKYVKYVPYVPCGRMNRSDATYLLR